jgi:hypothetical protein
LTNRQNQQAFDPANPFNRRIKCLRIKAKANPLTLDLTRRPAKDKYFSLFGAFLNFKEKFKINVPMCQSYKTYIFITDDEAKQARVFSVS